jgi:hypothetical protein
MAFKFPLLSIYVMRMCDDIIVELTQILKDIPPVEVDHEYLEQMYHEYIMSRGESHDR